MDITYCNKKCSIGKAAKERILLENNSVFSAAIAFNYFVKECFKTCPYNRSNHIVLKETKE